MKDAATRLAMAREAAGFPEAADAARAMGIKYSTYAGHENGSRGFALNAERYARFFRVDLNWLLTGRGEMKDKARGIKVTGLVGAGDGVAPIGDTSGHDAPDEINLPTDGTLAALKIRGESQYPRFLDGEYILYDTRTVAPESLIGQYAVVQTMDGRQMIKMLYRSAKGGDKRWRLWSHNAPEIDPIELMGAWRYMGVLPRK